MELRPRTVFLTGSNGIETQATAARNAGSGFIMVPEIKSGKARYTDFQGSYAPLLGFYDTHIPANSFRKADPIPVITNCRIQLLAAGVNEDYIQFIRKSGPTSGSPARVLPVLAYDRELVRLQRNRLPLYTFSLSGMKTAYGILESHFSKYASYDLPPLTIQFSSSELMDAYRNTNDHLTSEFRDNAGLDLQNVVTTLLNKKKNPFPLPHCCAKNFCFKTLRLSHFYKFN